MHRRVYLDYIGVKRFDADGRPAGEFRIVGLFTSTVYIRSTRIDSVSAPQGRRRAAARRLRSGQPFRQGAGQRAGDLSARRAVPDRRGHALSTSRSRSCSSKSGRACACWRGRDRFDRFVSVLVYVPRERYSAPGARRRSANISPRSSTAASARTIRTIHDAPLTRVHFIIGRDGGPTPEPDRADARSRASARSCAPGPMRLATRWRGARPGARPRAARRAIATLSRDGYRDAYPPEQCGRRHPRHRGAVGRTGRSASISIRAARTASPASA